MKYRMFTLNINYLIHLVNLDMVSHCSLIKEDVNEIYNYSPCGFYTFSMHFTLYKTEAV